MKRKDVPTWDSRYHLLYLPASAKGWDVELTDASAPFLLIRPGLYRLNFATPIHVRPLGKTEWVRVESRSNPLGEEGVVAIEKPEPCSEMAYAGLITPDSHFVAGEKLLLQFLPAKAGFFEVQIHDGRSPRTSILDENTLRIDSGLPVGSYEVLVRWVQPLEGAYFRCWSKWSHPLKVRYHPRNELQKLQGLRIYEHQLLLICEQDIKGQFMITDPWAFPPACPENDPVRWFRTPCYDGSGMLLNEQPDYYRDPLGYYLDCIQVLKDRGFHFRAWHDLLDGEFGQGYREVLIQFDLDAGPLSMERLYDKLVSMGVRATIMIHRECHDWYSYRIEDLNLDLLKDAEHRGWTIGYHNNSITNVQRLDRLGDYSQDILSKAKERFREDVLHLRQWFNIRTFSHHGGNVFNKFTPIPDGIDVVCVDRPFNKELWKKIKSSFSDGGFMSRPCSLREKVKNLYPGLHFFRNHPIKYANYTSPFDVPPLEAKDVMKTKCEVNQELINWCARERQKQKIWLKLRDQHRLVKRLSYASPDKPISRGFGPFSSIQVLAEKFRARRHPKFLREYPWIQGDPRVFWWRMLDAYAPTEGDVLNVGALPPDRRDETTSFISPPVRVLELDVDPKREPDILCDITNPPPDMYNRFSGVLLLGLPYIHSPSKAVEACAKLARPGGVGLFGFSADTHPLRGGLWNPVTRPVWKREQEPLQNIGLNGLLWSFDQECLRDLFLPWQEVCMEFFGHYWFAVCRKESR